MVILILALACSKLAILFFISRNTTRANKESWNDRAVDLRYLAERLRAMFYLPRLGIQQPPAAAPAQFASRVIRQIAIDWLFDSLSRAVSPADLPDARPLDIPTHDGAGTLQVKKLLTFDAHAEVERIRNSWIAQQINYHEQNSRTQHAMRVATETVGKWLGRGDLIIVVFDIAYVVAELLHRHGAAPPQLAGWLTTIAPFVPWLMVLTALLPAIVAALGGVRFQSECQRLAESSGVMRVLLGGRVHHPEAAPVGFWKRYLGAVGRFFANVWVVLRHLFGKPPAPPPIQYTGGRWKEALTLAERIAAARTEPATDPATWSHDALRLAERTATDFVQEVAGWSVLYTKEVSEPG